MSNEGYTLATKQTNSQGIVDNVAARAAAELALSLVSDAIRESCANTEQVGKAWRLLADMVDAVTQAERVHEVRVSGPGVMEPGELKRFEGTFVPFGRHKVDGTDPRPIGQIEPSYLAWISEQPTQQFALNLHRYLQTEQFTQQELGFAGDED